MGLKEKLRHLFFWQIDLIKGGRVKRHFKEIDFVFSNFNSEKAKEIRKNNLNAILTHASSTTPFYKNLELSNRLEDFPLINKNMIKENYDSFKSETCKGKNNTSVYTSGSTGTPFKIYHDANKRVRNTADTIYFAGLTGFKVGFKLVYLRHWDQYNSKRPLLAFMQNILMHPVAKLSNDDVGQLFKKLEYDKSPKGILSYASALDNLSKYIDVYKPEKKDYKVKSIIAMAERLSDYAKSTLETFFNVPVVSRYSNVENGIIAQQLPNGSKDFLVNTASYHIEILDLNEDKPVKPGEVGRIVVTDLFNRCMPMIRYETGDIGAFSEIDFNGNKLPALTKVEGRRMDMIFNTKGEHISSYTVYHLLKYANINQFQFIQEGQKQYLLKLNVNDSFNCEQDILEEFRSHIGEDANIRVEYVNEIPLLSSGKRKLVVNAIAS